MEIREIFDTIESDPNIDKELQQDILEKIKNIAEADNLVDGLEEKIEQHKDDLTEKELKYIINKCISYKSIFYRFRNGGIVDYDQLNEITRRIFELEKGIRENDFHVWKEELLAYKGSKQDKEEDKMLKNMLTVVPEESNPIDKITRMIRRAIWKAQQKAKQKKNDKVEEVIQLPQNTNIDISLHDFEDAKMNVEENIDTEEEKTDIPGFEEDVSNEDNNEEEK